MVSISNLMVRARVEFDAALQRERPVIYTYLVTDLMMADLGKMMDFADVFTAEQVAPLLLLAAARRSGCRPPMHVELTLGVHAGAR